MQVAPDFFVSGFFGSCLAFIMMLRRFSAASYLFLPRARLPGSRVVCRGLLLQPSRSLIGRVELRA